MSRFEGNCLPCLIGSLPFTDYVQAAGLVWEYTPEIPLWVQLPSPFKVGFLNPVCNERNS
jgi:hypothetical protein